MLTKINIDDFPTKRYVKRGLYLDHVIEFMSNDYDVALVTIKNVRTKTLIAGLHKAIKQCKRSDDIKVSKRGSNVYLIRYRDVPFNGANWVVNNLFTIKFC